MIRIGILGAHGRMGQWVTKLLLSEFSSQTSLSAQVSRGDPLAPLLDCDVVIDFSSPEGMRKLAHLALNHRGKLPSFVVGSTGWTDLNYNTLEELASKTGVLLGSNFSSGLNIVSEILKKYASVLEKLKYTPVIVEAHHCHKKDAPSGSALTLQRAIDSKKPERIQTYSIRAGEVIGEHEVTFYGPGDQISIRHVAQDRSLFARGAIEVALWLAKNRNSMTPQVGLMGMDRYLDSLFQEQNT